MLKGVVFDAYGTLFDVFSVSQKCEEEYPGRGGEISQIWRQKQLEYSWLQTLMGQYKQFWDITEDALCYTLKSLGLIYNKDNIRSLMNSYYNLSAYSDVTEALQKFHPLKRVILTNGNAEMFDQLLVNTGVYQYLDGFLSADTVQLFKPRPEVYQIAVDYLKINKNELLFVSSNAWDIAGAKSFGFTTGWINRSHKPFEQLGVKSDYIVSSLLELTYKFDDINEIEIQKLS
jgi:2-haloacid dehalogenase